MRFLLVLFIIVAPVVELLAQDNQAQLAQSDRYLNEKHKENTDLPSQLSTERNQLNQHQQELQEAIETLNTVQQDLDRIQEDASSGDANAERLLRFTKLLLNRQQDKVDRIRQRIAESDAQVSQLESQFEAATDSQNQLLNKKQQLLINSGNNPTADQKPPRNSNREEFARLDPQPTGKPESKPKVVPQIQPNKTATLPIDIKPEPQPNSIDGNWPYLSDSTAADLRYAADRLLQLQTKKVLGETEKAPLNSIEIKAPLSFGNAQMEYLGESLFTVVKPLRSGRQNFQLFNQEYWHVIPESDDNTEYRFIYDISSLSKPVLYLFREDLVNP